MSVLLKACIPGCYILYNINVFFLIDVCFNVTNSGVLLCSLQQLKDSF